VASVITRHRDATGWRWRRRAGRDEADGAGRERRPAVRAGVAEARRRAARRQRGARQREPGRVALPCGSVVGGRPVLEDVAVALHEQLHGHVPGRIAAGGALDEPGGDAAWQ
jgi:hypothetical protein